jgi:hypothetical protein
LPAASKISSWKRASWTSWACRSRRSGRGPHGVDLGFQRVEGGVGDLGRGGAPGHLFQRRPHRVHLAHLLLGDGADAHPAVGLALDEAHRLQVAQRLPDRRLAHPVLLHEVALDDALAGRVVAVEDALEDPLAELLTQDRAVQQLRHTLDYR